MAIVMTMSLMTLGHCLNGTSTSGQGTRGLAICGSLSLWTTINENLWYVECFWKLEKHLHFSFQKLEESGKDMLGISNSLTAPLAKYTGNTFCSPSAEILCYQKWRLYCTTLVSHACSAGSAPCYILYRQFCCSNVSSVHLHVWCKDAHIPLVAVCWSAFLTN